MPQTERVSELYIASAARPVSSQPDIKSGAVEEFRGPKGSTVATTHPVAKATMMRLSELWPQPAAFDQLLTDVQSRLGLKAEETSEKQIDSELRTILINTYSVGLSEFYSHPFSFAVRAGDRPLASPLARFQAQTDETVTNLRHKTVRLEDDVVRRLLLLLDGTRDRTAILSDLRQMIVSGEISIDLKSDNMQEDEIVSAGLERNLDELADLALLIA